jgi:tRNA U34 5-carboxymethylaminomethyl modifying enzyme MnmG/GidA
MTQRRFPGSGHVYDLIVVGAGLSGAEAAWACAKAGWDVLLVTTSLDTVCNLLGDGAVLEPPGGTLMAQVHGDLADERGFVANLAYHRRAKALLEEQSGLHLLQSSASALRVDEGLASGVETWEGVARLAPRVALCVGSFLQARLRVGALSETAGRLSEMAYDDLYDDLVARGFAFEPLTLEAGAATGSLAYTVTCQRFADGEWERESLRLTRLGGLYAAGVCAAGYLPFEAAASEGKRLAERLLTEG